MRHSKVKKWNSEVVRLFCKETGAANPFKAIERVCAGLLDQLGKAEPPFQSEKYEFADMLNVRVVESEISCDGLLALAGTRFYIQVKKDNIPESKNFTVCHELGHVEMLRRATKSFSECRSLMSGRARLCEEEQLSNHFAASLLMPEHAFVPRAAKLTPSVDSLAELANDFGTSIEATVFRLKLFDVWKCHFFWCVPELMANKSTAIRLLKLVKSPSVECPVEDADYVRWGTKSVRTAYEENTSASERLEFRRHSAAAPEYWLLQTAKHTFKKQARVLALLSPFRDTIL
jgi:hypothetical protein